MAKRAVLITSFDGPAAVAVKTVDAIAAIPPTSCKIDVSFAALNFPDVLLTRNLYQFKPSLPFSPGGEISGVVAAAGSHSRFKVGDRVAALTGWGGMREEVLVDDSKMLLLPPNMDMKLAGATFFTYGTSYHALKQRAQIDATDRILVLGASGGVGMAAVEIAAKVFKCKQIVAACSTQEKGDAALSAGATDFINYSKLGPREIKAKYSEITQGDGFDVVYDAVGGVFSEPAIRSLAWKGRYLVVGFAAGDIPKVPLNLALLKGASIVGVFWGSFTAREPDENSKNNAELIEFLQNGTLAPAITRVYSLESAKDALLDMEARKVVGKVVVAVSSNAKL